jgi:hypothetical protein
LIPKAGIHIGTLSGLGGFVFLLALAVCGCRLGEDHVKSTRPSGCAECHIDIVCQWQSSPHASAWTSAAFQEMAAGDSYCTPCHAPEPLLEQPPSDAPRVRDHDRVDGVDCHACHAYCGAYAGPYETFGPHGMAQDLVHLPCSGFCGRCHAMEYEEYETLYLESMTPGCAPECGDCHMPIYIDRLTQGHLLSYIHPKREVHDHSFPLWTPLITAGCVEISELTARMSSTSQLVIATTLINRGAGHRIPTGEFGHNEVRLLVQIVDDANQVVGETEESVFAGDDKALSPQAATPFAFEVNLAPDARPSRVDLTVEVVNEDRTFRYALAQQSASL